MKDLLCIFVYLVFNSHAGKPPYQEKLACRNKGKSCRFHVFHNLKCSIKSAVVTWSAGTIDVAIGYRIKNMNRKRPDSIDFNAVLMACSNNIPIEQTPRKVPANCYPTSASGIVSIGPSASIDTVLHFFSQGRYSRSAGVGTIKDGQFFIRYSSGPIDTLASVEAGHEDNVGATSSKLTRHKGLKAK